MVRFVPLALALLALPLGGCGDLFKKRGGDAGTDASADAGASALSAPANPTADLEKSFDALDINDDDQLDGLEVSRCGCSTADANGDGEITKAEYIAGGLAGKFRPSVSRPGPPPAPRPAPGPNATPNPDASPTQSPSPAPAPGPGPAPAPAAGGVPPGLYTCSGTVGGVFMTTGRVLIVDATRYATGADGSGPGTYTFAPDTGQIVFTSGPNANLDTVSFARFIAPNRIQMKTGKNGRSQWDCKR